MSDLRRSIEANRRGLVLQALIQDPAREMSEMILQRVLVHFGHSASLIATAAVVDWLAERRLVDVREVSATLRIARLTQPGMDCANGLSAVSGVEIPLDR